MKSHSNNVVKSVAGLVLVIIVVSVAWVTMPPVDTVRADVPAELDQYANFSGTPASGQQPKPTTCPPRGYCFDAIVARAVDGDTLECRVEMVIRLRLQECYAAEVRTTNPVEKYKGLAAKDYMRDIAEGKPVRVFVAGSGKLSDLFSFGRIVGRAYLIKDGEPLEHDLSHQMVAAGLATRTKKKKE